MISISYLGKISIFSWEEELEMYRNEESGQSKNYTLYLDKTERERVH